MNSSLSDFSGRLITLNDGRAGIRGGIHVEIREDSSNCRLDFISSDESLDRYNEVISAAGWQLHNYRRNPVFQNAPHTGEILHTIGRALVAEIRGGTSSTSPYLFQTVEFACDVNPMARIAYG